MWKWIKRRQIRTFLEVLPFWAFLGPLDGLKQGQAGRSRPDRAALLPLGPTPSTPMPPLRKVTALPCAPGAGALSRAIWPRAPLCPAGSLEGACRCLSIHGRALPARRAPFPMRLHLSGLTGLFGPTARWRRSGGARTGAVAVGCQPGARETQV